MYGLNLDRVMCCGIVSYLYRSAVITLSRPVESYLAEQFFGAFYGFFHSFTDWIVLTVAWMHRLSLIPSLVASGMDLRT